MAAIPGSAAPVVSVVVPVFNGAATLGRALGSVLAQSLQDLEVLVVDDGSSDSSLAVAERVGDPRVRCIRHDRNRGAAAARNTGILAARGRYVAFIDSDDQWLPDKLARQCSYLSEAAAGVTAVCTGFVLQRHDTASGHVRIPRARHGWAREMLDVCAVAPGTTLMIERRLFDEIGLICTDLVRFEDWDWLLRFLARYDLVVVPEPLAVVHSSPYRVTDVVDRSARLLLQRQAATVRRTAGFFAERTFEASLWLERAVVRWRTGAELAAIACTARAFLLSPARVGRLAARGMRKIVERDV